MIKLVICWECNNTHVENGMKMLLGREENSSIKNAFTLK